MHYNIDDLPYLDLCDCDEKHVRSLGETFEHVKREYYWIIREFVCLECEMCWVKRTYCVGKGDNWEITQAATDLVEE